MKTDMCSYKTIYFILLGLITLISCTEQDENDTENQKTDTKEIRSFLHAYHDAVNHYGVKAELNFFDSSEQFFWIPPGYAEALNFDSVKSILLIADDAIRQTNFEWESLHVQFVEDNVASFNGVVKGTITDTSNLTININQIKSGLLIKRKDGWKILNGQSTTLGSSSDYNPKREIPVDMVTVLILPVGEYILINKQNEIYKAQNKKMLEPIIAANLTNQQDKKVKIKVSHETNYMRVHEVLSLFIPNGWTPILSVIE